MRHKAEIQELIDFLKAHQEKLQNRPGHKVESKTIAKFIKLLDEESCKQKKARTKRKNGRKTNSTRKNEFLKKFFAFLGKKVLDILEALWK